MADLTLVALNINLKNTGFFLHSADLSLSTQSAELLKRDVIYIRAEMTGVRGIARLSFNFALVSSSGQMAEGRLQSDMMLTRMFTFLCGWA